ncbi:MAG: response regulator [Gammaproteobacteria bacterium]|nr:response regulator [Gammaproteobacteria bacterium]
MAKHAFLVDDSKSARIVLGRLLKKNGFDEVDMAESGEQALEQLKSKTPDAIFVDFLMDGMDGLETISEIKKDERFTHTPVVMCTANEGERYMEAAVDHGALGILAKPPTDDSLKEIIQLIDNKKEESGPAGEAAIETATPLAAGISEDRLRELAIEAARSTTESVAAGIAQEKADAIAREVAQDTLNEMLEPMVKSLVEKRLGEIKPPEVDLDSLRGEVVSQVNSEMEEFVRQVNERTVEGLIEASIYEQVHELANDFTKRMQMLKDEILAQVPDKHEMLEHIRVVTEGSMEAVVRETSAQVAQEVSNSTATETVEQILDEHLANQAAIQVANRGNRSGRWILWLGILLVGAGAGYGIYLSKIFQ